MKQDIIYIVWPPAMKFMSDIIKEVGKKFKIKSYSIIKLEETTTWLEIVNLVYNRPVDQVTVKRYKKAEGLEDYPKELGVIQVEVVDLSTRKKGGRRILSAVHDVKDYLRDKKYAGIIPRWYVVHSTESTEETEETLNNFDLYKNRTFFQGV